MLLRSAECNVQKNSASKGATSLNCNSIESREQLLSVVNAQRDHNTSLSIGGASIRQDADGRYCLNDLHRAAGGVKKHQPSDWLRIDQTKELVFEIQTPGNPGIETTGQPVVSVPGRSGGTYVCKELVYAYATWISPSFHLRVIRAYDAMMTASAVVDPLQIFNDPVAMRQVVLSYADKLIEQAPKVAALERIAAADGSMCITNAAKTLRIRPRSLFDWLSANRWIYRRPGGHWIAYQPRLQSGYLRHRINAFARSDGTDRIAEQVMVTSKGLSRLAESLPMLGGAQ